MSEVPSTASVVVIGAGIVGNSVVGHLAELGWRDIVQIDKGPLPNPGGSTGHASNFIFPVDHNKEMAMLTLDSQRQYEEMGVNVTCGGIEVARTEERMEELRRRMSSAKNWDMEAHLVSPAEIKELVPFINEEILIGGCYFPTVSAVDSLRAGTIFRERAQGLGALQTLANTEILGIETTRGRVKAVVTDKGRVEADYVVIACGVWSPRIARMAGATIPLTPAVHQMIDVGPIPILQESGKELAFPIVRDMDTFMYERQTSGSMEVGSYAHRPIFHSPDEIPSISEARMSPTELPFTADDFDDQLEDALELMPEILSGAEIKYAVNGLLSLTPDAMPLDRRDRRGPQSVVGCCDLDQRGAGNRAGGGGVDDPRLPRARSPRLRHRPFLPLCPHRAPRPGSLCRAFQQDLRDRPSPGAMGLRAGQASLSGPFPNHRPGRGLFRGRRLGAPALV